LQLNTGKHIPILDTLRGIAALSVCLFHFICTTTGFIHNKLLLSVFDHGKLGVHMFFIISGFVIPWSLYNAGYLFRFFPKFLLKRFIRLEPPYLISIIIAITLLAVKRAWPGLGTPEPLPSSSQVFLHFGYLIPFFEGYQWLNQVFWTLAIEFQYYITIGLLFPLIIHPNKWIRFLFYGSFLAAQFIGSSAFLPYWLPIFLLGILLFLKLSGKISPLEYYLVSVTALAFVFFRVGIPSLVICFSTCALILFATGFSTRLSRFFGDISYSIYLVHSLVGAAVVNFFSHHADTIIKKLATIGAGVAVTVLSAFLMYLIIERPSKKLSSKLKWKKE
jgi:peptidoglycan/LPS O-acetylase OafA/YrhL